MQISVYLPVPIEERLKEYPELNLSYICREAVIAYLDKRELQDQRLETLVNNNIYFKERLDKIEQQLSEIK